MKITAPIVSAGAIGILLIAVVFARVPSGTVWLSRLNEFAHGPIFGCVAVLLLMTLRQAPASATIRPLLQYAAAFIGASVLGLFTEGAQFPAGGDVSWTDARHDLLGAAAFLLIFAAFDPHGRVRAGDPRRAAALVAGVGMLVYLATPLVEAAIQYGERHMTFPVIADFSTRANLGFVSPHGVLIEFAPLPEDLRTGPAEFAARVHFLPRRYAGLNFHEPSPDWTGYSELAIEIANPANHALTLVARVHDAHHNNEFEDRYNQRFTAPAHERKLFRFPLADVERAPRGRKMDMNHIRGLLVFRPDETPADDIYLLRVWLE